MATNASITKKPFALAKGVSHSPRKVGEVASLIRGRSVEDALTILQHTPRRSAIAVRKVVESAKANADYNHGYKPATLTITEITVTAGPRLKRFRAQAMGRAAPFMKRTSHIRVTVDGELRESKKPVAAKPTIKPEETK